MTLAERIHAARLAKHLTLEQLGQMTGVGKSAINKYEKGVVTNIPPERLELLANALDVTPGYLMGWSELPGQQALFDLEGYPEQDRARIYAEAAASVSRRSAARRELEALLDTATESQIDLLLKLVREVVGK